MLSEAKHLKSTNSRRAKPFASLTLRVTNSSCFVFFDVLRAFVVQHPSLSCSAVKASGTAHLDRHIVSQRGAI